MHDSGSARDARLLPPCAYSGTRCGTPISPEAPRLPGTSWTPEAQPPGAAACVPAHGRHGRLAARPPAGGEQAVHPSRSAATAWWWYPHTCDSSLRSLPRKSLYMSHLCPHRRLVSRPPRISAAAAVFLVPPFNLPLCHRLPCSLSMMRRWFACALSPGSGRPPGKDVPHDGHDGPPPGGSLGTSSSIMHHSPSRLFCLHPSNRNTLFQRTQPP